VTIKDNNGCTFTATTFITQPTLLNIATAVAPNSCAGSVGSVTITGSGGTPVYTYSVDGLSSANIVNPLTSGTHTATVKDANSCTLTLTYNVGNTGSPVSGVGSQTNVSCFGGTNGGVTITTAGGTPGYSYTITPTGVTSGSGVFTSLTAGAYTVNVKDAAGC